MEYSIEIKPVLRELQKEVAQILNETAYLKDRGITVLCEDSLEIEYEIKRALGNQGLVTVVNVLQTSYIGHDSLTVAWQIDNLEIDIVENPSVWRPYLKKHSFEDGTSIDLAHIIAESLGGPQSGRFGRFCPKSIEQGEDSDLIVTKIKFQTTVRQNVEGIIEEPTKVELPFVTRVEIADLISEIESLKSVVEGFSTEEIKQDIEDLKTADLELGSRIDGLGDVYQPKGSYVLTSDLEPYALKTQIPTNTSQLNNDAGFLTQVSWGDVIQKPDVALASDIPTKTSDLVNDSDFITNVYWNDISDKPDVALVEDIPTKTSDLINDSGFLTSHQSLEAYATKADLNEAIRDEADIRRGEDSRLEAELELKANQTDIPTKTSDLINDSGFLTEHQSLESYATKNYVNTIADELTDERIRSEENIWNSIDTLAEKSEIPVKTSDLVNDSGFITENDIPAIPTRTSQLLNDSGFLTEHQSLENYATKNYVDTQPIDGDRIVNWPDFAYNGEVNMRFTEIDGRVNSIEDTVQTIPENINKVYGQYKARYIDGDRQYFEMGEEGYVKAGTLALKSEMPVNTSQLVNDSGYLTEVKYSDIIGKPFIPTKISELQNDEGFLKDISWEQVKNKPDFATVTDLQDLGNNVDSKLDLKLDKSEYDETSIQNSVKKIDANGDVFEQELIPGYYTDWEWSDGLQHDFGIITNPIQGRILYSIVIMGDPTRVCPEPFDSEQSAQDFLDTATEIEFSGSGVESITASREYIPDQYTWEKSDELAYKSDIVESEGITEDECRSIVEGYGYQTSTQVQSAITSKGYRTESQVESQITSKGYRTESQVESQITSKGYQTEQQVRSIASTVLPAGYSETVLTGTLEDGTEMSFTILTKANS